MWSSREVWHIARSGWGTVIPARPFADIQYAIYLNGTVSVYESGVSRGQFGPVVDTDTFRVAVENGIVGYRKNGSVFYTSTVPPTYPLLVDTHFWDGGNAVLNVVLSGQLTAVGGEQRYVQRTARRLRERAKRHRSVPNCKCRHPLHDQRRRSDGGRSGCRVRQFRDRD
jgi:hypothetical protein